MKSSAKSLLLPGGLRKENQSQNHNGAPESRSAAELVRLLSNRPSSRNSICRSNQASDATIICIFIECHFAYTVIIFLLRCKIIPATAPSRSRLLLSTASRLSLGYADGERVFQREFAFWQASSGFVRRLVSSADRPRRSS